MNRESHIMWKYPLFMWLPSRVSINEGDLILVHVFLRPLAARYCQDFRSRKSTSRVVTATGENMQVRFITCMQFNSTGN